MQILFKKLAKSLQGLEVLDLTLFVNKKPIVSANSWRSQNSYNVRTVQNLKTCTISQYCK